MGKVSTSTLGDVLYFCIPSISIYCIIYSTFTHDFLKHYYLAVLYCSLCFFLVCCLTTVSKICLLRRKPHAVTKPISRLYDSDLESDEEIVGGNEPNQFQPAVKLFRFCSSRQIYGLVAGVGALLMLAYFAIAIVLLFGESNSSKDLRSTALVLCMTLLALEVVVVAAATIPKSQETKRFSYQPFDKTIRIPMAVFIAKCVSRLLKSIPQLVADLFYQFAAIYGLVTVFSMPEEEIRRFEEATNMKTIHQLMIFIMVFANVSSIYMVIVYLATAWKLTEDSFLFTFEKNWERNLSACDFLLPKEKVATLEELRAAFINKSRQEQLKDEEIKAIWYILRPLWKSKRAFLDKPEGAERKLGKSLPRPFMELWYSSSSGSSGSTQGSVIRTPSPEKLSPKKSRYDLRPRIGSVVLQNI